MGTLAWFGKMHWLGSKRLKQTKCDGCGRYLCGDCKADWLGKTMCLGCIHTQREVKGAGEFQSRVTLYDNIALALVVFPFASLFYGVFLVLFTAPVALFLVIRYRGRSTGIG